MVSTNKKPKVPTPARMNADHIWSIADKFDNWVLEVLDYLVIHKVDPERGKEAIAYTLGYLEGVAKEFLRTWRAKPENAIRSLTDFLNDLRAFCIPINHKDKLWKTFAEIRQTTGNQSRPIQEVATELQMLKMRVPELSDTQLYY